MPKCFFAHLGGCEGRLVKAHLVPKSRLKQELRQRHIAINDVIWDERCWRFMCGGITGIGGHHGAYDAKQIRIPREQVPPDLVAFLAEYELGWMVERYF
jgi:hypothetical protein